MSCICVLTPVVVGSWPAIATAALGAAASLGFTVAGVRPRETGRVREPLRTVTSELPGSEVLAEGLAESPGDGLEVEKDGVRVRFGRDAQGRCSVCVEGRLPEEALRRLGEEVAGRVVQQFVYHKLLTELENRSLLVVEEQVLADRTVQLRVRVP